MTLEQLKLFETAIIILVYLVLLLVNKKMVSKTLDKAPLQRARRLIIIKALQLFITLIALTFLAAIWGFKQNEIAAFAGTLLTALGIAFFAQWSLLSNITSSIILFFNHPLKLGDTIKVFDKDYPIEGEIVEMTYFFVYVKTLDGELVTIPNALILQKSVAVIESKENGLSEFW